MKEKETDQEKATAALKKANKAFKEAYSNYKKESKGGKKPSPKNQLAAKTTLDELVVALSDHGRVHSAGSKKKRSK